MFPPWSQSCSVTNCSHSYVAVLSTTSELFIHPEVLWSWHYLLTKIRQCHCSGCNLVLKYKWQSINGPRHFTKVRKSFLFLRKVYTEASILPTRWYWRNYRLIDNLFWKWSLEVMCYKLPSLLIVLFVVNCSPVLIHMFLTALFHFCACSESHITSETHRDLKSERELIRSLCPSLLAIYSTARGLLLLCLSHEKKHFFLWLERIPLPKPGFEALGRSHAF